MTTLTLTLFPLLICLSTVGFMDVTLANLSYDHYHNSCPHLESLVAKTLMPIFLTDPTSPSAFLRLMFHDCQVQGCDASILLDSNGESISSEMLSGRNFGIRRREAIDMVKRVVEAECPTQVSCADLIILAARESVAFAGGPRIRVPLGRRDSTTASNRRADTYIPSSTVSVDNMLRIFMSKGMTMDEAIAILGGHTLGVSHCINVVNRLYPSYESEKLGAFGIYLRLNCPTMAPLTNLTFIPNDLTPFVFDNHYYKDLKAGRGLLSIDSSISTDPRTAPIVDRFSRDSDYFFFTFSSAFVKLSTVGVPTGKQGQIRNQCSQLN
ncbi:hypothetical protein AMTRI_Chr12g234730 [Amborella trichopoda]|uniref:Peroxidase n=1 Tax=Amborella trichopoda TaxID=13333 RepID=W1PEJ5_AMBTC|nr:peroxidase 29 [Amborella trichopoda]ERN05480.1 hypothetical protein AMTR_s00007p00253160 [Amborella trichopoda]|eukprot:XP_006843805.3 peroxidase 29 [Amborella trichopoda]